MGRLLAGGRSFFARCFFASIPFSRAAFRQHTHLVRYFCASIPPFQNSFRNRYNSGKFSEIYARNFRILSEIGPFLKFYRNSFFEYNL